MRNDWFLRVQELEAENNILRSLLEEKGEWEPVPDGTYGKDAFVTVKGPLLEVGWGIPYRATASIIFNGEYEDMRLFRRKKKEGR